MTLQRAENIRGSTVANTGISSKCTSNTVIKVLRFFLFVLHFKFFNVLIFYQRFYLNNVY